MSDNKNMNRFGRWLVRNKRRLEPVVFLSGAFLPLFMMSLICPNDKRMEEAFRKSFVICASVFFYIYMRKISDEVNRGRPSANRHKYR